MISLLSNSTPADTSAVFALLSVIADPKAAQARLDALTAEKQAALDAVAAAEQKNREVEALRKEVEAGRAELDAGQAAAKDAAEKSAAQQEAKDARLTKREAALSSAQAAHAQNVENLKALTTALDERTAMVETRENDIAALEAVVAKAASEAEALKAEYEQKLAALKNLVKD